MSRVLPILFNTDMVRAILDGRKMVTRRALKQPFEVHPNGFITKPRGNERLCPYGPPYQPGNILYVRETWQECCRHTVHSPILHCRYCYKASIDSVFYGCIEECGQICNWHPSIHMPKEAARIWLKVTDVKVERLQDIGDDGVVAEGLQVGDPFDELWDSTIKKSDLDCYGWDANPWVWVIEFERCEKPEENDNTKEIADFLNERENGI